MTALPTVLDVTLVLRRLLDRAEFRGASEFREQIEFITGISGQIDYLDIELSPSAPIGVPESYPLQVTGDVSDAAGEPLGEILIWVEKGKLACVEYAEYMHQYDSWPTLDQIVAVTRIQV